MKKDLCNIKLVLLFLMGFAVVLQAATIDVGKLKCQFRTNPLGVDSPSPALSWQIQPVNPDERGQKQTAYHVLVSSSSNLLRQDTGDLWDSGKVVSEQSIQIAYSGDALQSEREYYWKVRCWDKTGVVSDWSESAFWTMGLLNDSDWQAGWIGRDPSNTGPSNTSSDWGQAWWIWYPEGDPLKSTPADSRYFRRTVNINNISDITATTFMVTADNAYEVFVNGIQVGSDSNWERAEKYDIKEHLVKGKNVIATKITNGGGPGGWAANMLIESKLGKIWFPTDDKWLCSKKYNSKWFDVDFDDSSWSSSMPFGVMGISPWGDVTRTWNVRLPIFRKTFNVRKAVKNAKVYISGLGHYELSVNGKKIGDQFLANAWSVYEKTVYYDVYDITTDLQQNVNAFGLMLGKGFYNTNGDRRVHGVHLNNPLKFILQARIQYTDGTSDLIISDSTWKLTEGPITHNAILGGTDYDARLLPVGWNTALFDDSEWESAMPTDGPGGELIAAYSPPMKSFDVFKPVKIEQPQVGYYVYDFGQNASAQPRLVIQGQAGQKVRLTPAEQRHGQTNNSNNGTGRVDQSSVGSPNYWEYTLRGGNEETWIPQFQYTGYQYIELTGGVPQSNENSNNLPVVKSLDSIHVRADCSTAGQFECSKKLFNDTHKLIDWAARSNIAHVLTDCPHREKLGWLEVAYLVGPSIAMNYDLANYYNKIERDIRDSQSPDGKMFTVAPNYPEFPGGFRYTPEWGAAGIILPWQLYRWYGDKTILAESYAAMKAFVDYMHNTSTELVPIPGLGDWYDYGHGQSLGDSKWTPPTLTAMATFYRCTKILADSADLLGNDVDKSTYTDLAAQIKTKFNAEYFNGTNEYTNNGSCQTANSIALVSGLVEPEEQTAVLDKVIEDLRNRGNQQTAGDVGYYYLVNALRRFGHSDVLFDINNRHEVGSYGSIIDKGWTSLPESWNVVLVNSLNHVMLGHVTEWFHKDVLGISQTANSRAYKEVLIKPEVVGDLIWAKGYYDSPFGRIENSWKLHGGMFVLDVTIPANSTAIVYVPAKTTADVREGSGSASSSTGVEFLRMENGKAVYRVQSGKFHFFTQGNPMK
ncbi:MAG: family 78 glycoside hydrolase catalytic domain [Sedimentisphaerales bacterium]|nr:family 78 glycoside hydrolase catalytic domain [Sedimentisphaerales bacterium]